MNILFLFEKAIVASQGGVERVSCLLGEYFQKKGHNVYFLSTSPGKDESINKFQLFIDTSKKDFIKEIQHLFNEYKVDLIINQSLNKENEEVLKVAEERKIKIISVLHNQPFTTLGKERKFKTLTHPQNLKSYLLKYFTLIFPSVYRKERLNFEKNRFNRFFKLSDKFLFLSEKYINRISEEMPEVDLKKLDYINNPNTFNISIDNLEDSDKENLIIVVGRMVDPQKNIKEFLDVWKLFSQSHPDWKALIIGDGPHKKEYERYAKKIKIKNLEFTGSRQDVSSFYRKAKFFCMTSLYEGWPMVLAEAMAYGCVPLAYNTFEALDEIILHDKTGAIIPPFKPELMAKELERLADNDLKRIELAENGKAHIKKFSIEFIGKIWQDKINALI